MRRAVFGALSNVLFGTWRLILVFSFWFLVFGFICCPFVDGIIGQKSF